ncbi:AraC family transcriptional regulator [Puniceicoccus vermicola]|uniref:Helix-turn-helix transcriptional regulator n=1 Tax=Puniceicoccus vermicola TaxID=388746 RepID=A0A7X1E5K5_9BACT|nr:AraC family transcriptional regulator [Puniceicoccus vermicola]MBC2603138.1 helix-turn-helix transcriptional regulator [Puniceicoccus vermicola]
MASEVVKICIIRPTVILFEAAMQGSERIWTMLNCRFYVNEEDWNWNSGSRPHFNFWVATQGGGAVRVNGVEYRLHSGVVFLFNRTDQVVARGDPEQGKVGNFATHFIPDSLSEPELEMLSRRLSGRSFRDCLWLMPALRDLSRDFSFGGIPDDPRLGTRLRLIFGLLDNEPDRSRFNEGDREVGEVVERIRRNPASTYSVEEMARSCGLSVSRFSRRFRDLVGLPPNQFMVQERLRTAEMLLLGGNESIEHIAERLGYRDVYFFSRQFRRHRGVSPSRFRRGFNA